MKPPRRGGKCHDRVNRGLIRASCQPSQAKREVKNMTCHYVSFSAEINPSTTENLINVAAQLVNQGATEINLLLSTPGGSVMHGITLYNVLRALPVRSHHAQHRQR